MITLRLRFPASRYHANPWGRHVNEGVGEWPPSPYRLLRALYDTWKRKCSHLSEDDVHSVLTALAEKEPRFRLPAAAASHTRSYLSNNTEDPNDRSLVFDAFLAFDRDAACYLQWPELQLTADQRNVLSELLSSLNFLGRSESWIDADLYNGEMDAEHCCDPVGAAQAEGEVTPVACVTSTGEYTGKESWLQALTTSSAEVIKQRASSPPLLRSVAYVLPEASIQMDPVRPMERRQPRAQAVLLGLDATVLPLATAAIEVGEQIRVRLMGAHRKRMGGDPAKVSPLFSGKEEGEKRLDHGHVFILPLANHLGRIDRVLLLSKLRPFTRDEFDAIQGVQRLWQSDNRPDVRCVITWQGSLDDRAVRIPARTLVSGTPFVTTRHWRKGRDLGAFLEEEVRRECKNHNLPSPASVERMDRLGGLFDCIEYRRNRKDEPPRQGYAFRIVFNEPVLGPFSLGYGCHFGLGLFRSVENTTR